MSTNKFFFAGLFKDEGVDPDYETSRQMDWIVHPNMVVQDRSSLGAQTCIYTKKTVVHKKDIFENNLRHDVIFKKIPVDTDMLETTETDAVPMKGLMWRRNITRRRRKKKEKT